MILSRLKDPLPEWNKFHQRSLCIMYEQSSTHPHFLIYCFVVVQDIIVITRRAGCVGRVELAGDCLETTDE